MVKSRETSVAILGVAIDNLTMVEVLDAVEAEIAEGGFHQIATANVDFLLRSVHDEELRETLCRCDLVVADGMPLVWASRLLGTGLKERVTGADLVPQLAKLSARRGYRLFLLGASEESLAGTIASIERTYPGACIAGSYSPTYQSLEEMNHEDILFRIKEARPDILLVAFGNPKQEKWLAMHRHRLQVPVCIGVGGSFDFLSGSIARAPRWMQQWGMEWLYRTIQEPSRLAKRYASNAAGLFRYLPMQLMAMSLQPKRCSQAEINREIVGSATVLRIAGDFTGSVLPQFESEGSKAIVSGSHLVLDVSNTAYIGADALGTLVHLLNVARRWKRELWLTGLNPFHLWVFRAAKLGPYFRMAPKVSEALRRIEPELAPVPQNGADWAFCRIGGQLVPVHTQEVPELYRQVQLLLNQRLMTDAIPVGSSDNLLKNDTIQEMLPEDAGWVHSGGTGHGSWAHYPGNPGAINELEPGATVFANRRFATVE